MDEQLPPRRTTRPLARPPHGAADRPTPTRQYHWMATVQYPAPGGIRIETRTGIWGAREGDSRRDATAAILDHIAAEIGMGHWPHVLFFSLEPDQL